MKTRLTFVDKRSFVSEEKPTLSYREKVFNEYLKAMNFSSAKKYQEWCVQHNFDTKLNKNKKELQKEFDFYLKQEAKIIFSNHNKRKKVRTKEVCKLLGNGDIHISNPKLFNYLKNNYILKDSHFKRIINIFKKFYNDILDINQSNRNILEYNIVTLIKIVEYKKYWTRDLSNFKIQSRSIDRNIKKLIQHLFVQYPTPKFLYNSWKDDDKFIKNIFIPVAQGKSVFNCLRLVKSPPVTKKLAYNFINLKEDLEINEALRKAQLKTLNIQQSIIDQIINSPYRNSFTNENLLQDYLTYINKENFFDEAQTIPLFDFLVEKYKEKDFKKKAIHNLLNEMEDWHQELGVKKTDYTWINSGIEGMDVEVDKQKYTITEVLSSFGLREEGKELSHCVASYASSCKRGDKSIFSLKKKSKRLITIEVNLFTDTIVQARGKANRYPNNIESSLIKKWANLNNINSEGVIK